MKIIIFIVISIVLLYAWNVYAQDYKIFLVKSDKAIYNPTIEPKKDLQVSTTTNEIYITISGYPVVWINSAANEVFLNNKRIK